MTRVLFSGLLLAALLVACKKEVEIQIKEVDKVYSWMEIKRLYGTDGIILNMGKDANSVFMQTPVMLGILSPLKDPPVKNRFGYYLTAATYLPAGVDLRIPISADFLAFPVNDTLIQLTRPTEPVTNIYNDYINLRKLDPQANSFIRNETSWLPFGAINRNNVLLFGYRTTPGAPSTDQRFILTKIGLKNEQLQSQSQIVTIPLGLSIYPRIRWIVAIDDYFLANCGDAGLYKIRENGSAKQVFGYSVTDACYKWQGILYAVEEYNSILTSKDDGETWQRATGTPDAFNFTSYRAIGDSLVGVARQAGSNYLFTLRWSGPNYTVRALKNDGLGQGAISGIEQLGDTVYLGTTNGLFKRPLNKFFESKP